MKYLILEDLGCAELQKGGIVDTKDVHFLMIRLDDKFCSANPRAFKRIDEESE